MNDKALHKVDIYQYILQTIAYLGRRYMEGNIQRVMCIPFENLKEETFRNNFRFNNEDVLNYK